MDPPDRRVTYIDLSEARAVVAAGVFRAPRRVARSPRGQIPVSYLNLNVQSGMEDEGERATATLPLQTTQRAGNGTAVSRRGNSTTLRPEDTTAASGAPEEPRLPALSTAFWTAPAALPAQAVHPAARSRGSRGTGRVRGASRGSSRGTRCSRGSSRCSRGTGRLPAAPPAAAAISAFAVPPALVAS